MDRRELLDKAARDAEERMLLSRVWDKWEQCRLRNVPAAAGEVRLHEGSAVVDGVVRRRQEVAVDAVQSAAEGRIAHVHAVGPLPLVVQGHILRAAQLIMSKARYSSVSVAQAAPVRRMPST